MPKEKEGIKTDLDITKMEILHDSNMIVKKIIEDFREIKKCFDNCIDLTDPSVFFSTSIGKEFINLTNRGIKLRLITEISKDNLNYCKELLNIIDLRHLADIKYNFGVADGKDHDDGYASIIDGQPPRKLIWSNDKTFVGQQQFLFETLWVEAEPAKQKIKEIEEGIEPVKTIVLENQQEIFDTIVDFYKNSNRIKFCSPIEIIKIIYANFFNIHQEILDRYKKGNHHGIKWITSLNTKKDMDLIKGYIDKGIEIRHVKDLLINSFALSDKSFLFTIDKIEKGKWGNSLLSSNDRLYVDHYDTIFETLWKKGIDIQDRMKDIEEGYSFNIETIPNPIESLKFYKELLQKVKGEILIMLASSSAFFRIENNIGYDILEKMAYQNIKVKILFPMKIDFHDKINQLKLKYPRIDFGILHISLESFIGLTIIDKQRVLITEIKDDTKDNYSDAIGMTIYIEGDYTAMSYVTVFNSLWKQADLYEKLEKTFLNIQIHEKMQKEFINIAAHELRTPLQPILGFTEQLRNKLNDKEQLGFLDVIDRNTKRLKKLSDDILNVSQIETNLLILNKEYFKINEIIQQLIIDYKKQLKTKNIEIEFSNHLDIYDDLTIYADRDKIYQVISNLINNSIKFASDEREGKITITVKESPKDESDIHANKTYHNNHVVIITVKDNGVGIDKDILPTLFTKF
ncbi:MAG TPA: HAMP domain-containing sensor histidine kinase, partial [Candidatus Nitrosocosmicus sp.]|nr:HAMP domain-containing sensor histidine kinase [Candidatus Nitrosocosmicus sp.]